MRDWLRRLWGKNYVKLIRRIGEEEVLELSFNEIDGPRTLARLTEVLDFFYARMADHNKKVLNLEAELAQKSGGSHITKVK